MLSNCQSRIMRKQIEIDEIEDSEFGFPTLIVNLKVSRQFHQLRFVQSSTVSTIHYEELRFHRCQLAFKSRINMKISLSTFHYVRLHMFLDNLKIMKIESARHL